MFRRAALTALIAATVLSGCRRDGTVESDAERFCGEAAANAAFISDPPIGTAEELAATLDFYRLMGQLAPLAIATEWDTITAAYETASTVVPGDPESEQRMAKQIYAAEPSAYAVEKWLRENCRVDLPIVTIAPHDPPPTPTVAPADITAGPPSSTTAP